MRIFTSIVFLYVFSLAGQSYANTSNILRVVDTSQTYTICQPTDNTDTIHLSTTGPQNGVWTGTCVACVSPDGVFNPLNQPPGSYLLFYEQGSFEDTVLVTIFPQPQIALDAPDTVKYADQVSLTPSGAQDYTWSSIGDDLSCTDCTDPTFKADSGAIVQLIGTDIHGCTDTITKQIYIFPELVMPIPNAFTPNGDGFNDVFRPIFRGGDIFETYHLSIFSRWGERVFETVTPGEGWDGRVGDLPVSSDVYVYRFEYKLFDGKSGSTPGEVTLIR